MPVVHVALPVPLARTFDYLFPSHARPVVGGRVRVPFGRRQMIGVLIGTAQQSEVPSAKLKAAHEILDAEPVFDPVTFELLLWAADYYHHPVGEVIVAALPVALRRGQAANAVQAAPEPATLSLGLLGLVAYVVCRKYQNS